MPPRRGARRAPAPAAPADSEPLLGSLLACVFFGHSSLREVWPRSNHLASCTFRHILWWLLYGALICAGLALYFVNIISFQSETSSAGYGSSKQYTRSKYTFFL